MLRLTGAALILGAALRLQRSLSVRGRLRRKTLRALANAFLSLESAVRSTLTPLPALLQELRCESEAANFFADVTAGLASGEPLAAAWERAAKKLPIGTRERETVCALSRSLDGEEESVCAALHRASAELLSAERALHAREREDGRVVSALCFSGALLFAILLL